MRASDRSYLHCVVSFLGTKKAQFDVLALARPTNKFQDKARESRKANLKTIPWVNRRKFEQIMGNAALVATFSLPRRAEGQFFHQRIDGDFRRFSIGDFLKCNSGSITYSDIHFSVRIIPCG